MSVSIATITKVFLKSSPEYLTRLRTIVGCLADGVGMDTQETEDAKLAMTEVCVNAIRHGSPRGIEDTISVEFTSVGDTISADVTDCGGGIDYELPLNSSIIAGLGTQLINKLTDNVCLTNQTSGLTVSLMKRAKNTPCFENAVDDPIVLHRN